MEYSPVNHGGQGRTRRVVLQQVVALTVALLTSAVLVTVLGVGMISVHTRASCGNDTKSQAYTGLQ